MAFGLHLMNSGVGHTVMAFGLRLMNSGVGHTVMAFGLHFMNNGARLVACGQLMNNGV